MRSHLRIALLASSIAVGCSSSPPSSPGGRSGEPGGGRIDEVTSRASALLPSDVNAGLGFTNEPTIAVSPLNQSIIAVANCFTVSLSFDSGKTFLPADRVSIRPAPGHGGGGCDDVMAFDSHGRLFIEFLDFIPGGETDLFVQQIDVRRGIAAANRLVDASGVDCSAGGATNQCPIGVSHQLGLDACPNHAATTPGRSADCPLVRRRHAPCLRDADARPSDPDLQPLPGHPLRRLAGLALSARRYAPADRPGRGLARSRRDLEHSGHRRSERRRRQPVAVRHRHRRQRRCLRGRALGRNR